MYSGVRPRGMEMTKTWLSSSLREITVEREYGHQQVSSQPFIRKDRVSNSGMWGSKAGT